MSKTERREIHYSGWVQGVGFRYMTQGIAQRFEVTGFVENLADGGVQLVVEGEAGELDRFLAAVEQQLQRHIRNADVKHREATGEFDRFFIRR